jgi:hypothetical protein
MVIFIRQKLWSVLNLLLIVVKNIKAKSKPFVFIDGRGGEKVKYVIFMPATIYKDN